MLLLAVVSVIVTSSQWGIAVSDENVVSCLIQEETCQPQISSYHEAYPKLVFEKNETSEEEEEESSDHHNANPLTSLYAHSWTCKWPISKVAEEHPQIHKRYLLYMADITK